MEGLKPKMQMKIGFSKFASLQPKWCIAVGPKGMQSVCASTTKQNVKVRLDDIELEVDYNQLIEKYLKYTFLQMRF